MHCRNMANRYVAYRQLYLSSSTGCQFDGRSGGVYSEDNFGLYKDTNPVFWCSSNQNSTTQHWIGSKLSGLPYGFQEYSQSILKANILYIFKTKISLRVEWGRSVKFTSVYRTVWQGLPPNHTNVCKCCNSWMHRLKQFLTRFLSMLS